MRGSELITVLARGDICFCQRRPREPFPANACRGHGGLAFTGIAAASRPTSGRNSLVQQGRPAGCGGLARERGPCLQRGHRSWQGDLASAVPGAATWVPAFQTLARTSPLTPEPWPQPPETHAPWGSQGSNVPYRHLRTDIIYLLAVLGIGPGPGTW